jgi:hypothetical protein
LNEPNSIDAVPESVHADAAANEHGMWLRYESIYFDMIEMYTKYFCLLSGTTQEVQDERQETTKMEVDREVEEDGTQHHYESISSEL